MGSNYQITVTIDGRDNLSDELRQMNTQLTQIQQNTTNTNNSMSRMETQLGGLRTGFNNVNGMLQQFGLGLSAMGIVNAVQELGDLGREVNAVNTTFEQLSGGPEAAARSLQNMRDMTGGVVDDMTLMQGANSLLLTGLASTNDQAAELVNLGYRLSAAMGVDAAEGIQNLNAALLNNSFARLDTLGISAAAVRQRVEELKKEGMDMSEAFSAAVLEQGREKLLLLGDAANVGETAFARMTTRFENAKAGLAEFTAQGLEAGAQLIELIGLMGEVGVGNVLTAAGGGKVDLAGQARDAQIQTRTQEIVTEQLGGGTATEAMGMTAGFTPAEAMRTEQIAMQALNMQALAQATQEWSDAQISAAQQQAALADASALGLEREAEWLAVEEARLANAREAERANSTEQLMLEGLGVAYDALVQRAEEFQSLGGVEIMSADDADAMVANATLMEDWFADLSQMAEDTEFEYISEDELSRAEQMVEEAGALADEAQRAADNFEKMKLAQMLGESGGGRLGELSDMVLANIEDPEQRAAMERDFNMASGRETDVSVAFEEQIAPLLATITENMGSESGVAATERALAALEEGRLMGMTGEELVAAVTEAIGISQEGSEIAGQMGSDLAMQAGMSVPSDSSITPLGGPTTTTTTPGMDAWAMGMETPGSGGAGEAGGGGISEMPEQLQVIDELSLSVSENFTEIAAVDMSGVMDPFVHAMETADQGAIQVRTRLDAMQSTTFRTTLTVDVVYNDPMGYMGNSAGFQNAMATATGNNGGVPPGTGGGPN